jgi:hypothetical protein
MPSGILPQLSGSVQRTIDYRINLRKLIPYLENQHGDPFVILWRKDQRTKATDNWNARIKKSGYTTRTLPVKLEKAGGITGMYDRKFGYKIYGAFL